jgi:hypothetical protein
MSLQGLSVGGPLGSGVDRPDSGGSPEIGPEETAVERESGATAARRPAHARSSWLAFLAVLVVATGLIALHVHSYQLLSVFDEPQHVDYVNHLLKGDVEISGDRWTPATQGEVACRSIDYPLDYRPPCGGPYEVGLFPNYGLTTAFIHTPAYYAGPALAVLTGRAVGLPLDPVTLMRATGALWFGLALLFLWIGWRDGGVRWQARSGLALALISVPAVLLTQSTVTNDATALAAGAAITLAALRWDEGRLRLWVVLLFVVAAMLLKSTNLGVLLLVCAFALIRGLQRAWGTSTFRLGVIAPRRTWALVAGCAAASALVGAGWSVLSTARSSFDQRQIAQNVMYHQDSFHPGWVLHAVPSLLSPLRPQFFQAVLATQPAVVVADVANIALLVLAGIGALRAGRGSALRALGYATALTLLAFPAVLVLVNYVTAGIYAPIPARYGLCLVPALMVLAGGAFRGRVSGWLLLAAGTASTAVIATVLVSG